MSLKGYDVLDMTTDPEELLDEDENRIRLRSGIDVNQLVQQNEGVVFEAEVNQTLLQPQSDERTYFSKTGDKEFEEMMERLGFDEDDGSAEEDDDDGRTPFERKISKMTNLIDGGGVKKRTLRRGLESEGKPSKRGSVVFHYSLYLEGQDEPFDSSVLRGRPQRHLLDDGRLLPGVEIALKSMCKKEKAEFMIEPEYGFREIGVPPRIPGNSQILAHVELLDFAQEAEAEALLMMSTEDRNKLKNFAAIEEVVMAELLEGRKYFRQEEYKVAAKRFQRGIRLMEDVELKNDQEQNRQRQLLTRLCINRSICCIKIHRPKSACLDLQKALRNDPRNAKALYNMGKAKRMLGNLEEALNYLKRAQRVRPQDPDIGAELDSIIKQLKRQEENEAALCRRMILGSGATASTFKKDDDDELGDNVELDDDDFYAEVAAQLEAFGKNKSSEPMSLPPSFGKEELCIVKRLARDRGLLIEKRIKGGKEAYFVKKTQ